MGRPTVLRPLCGLLLVSVIAIGTAEEARAQALPHTINHQGRAFDASMTPLTGTHTLRFTLFTDDGTPGHAVWTEVHNIGFLDGYYQAELGRDTMLPASVLTASTSLFLGIAIDSDPEMTPRQPVDSVPY